MPNKNKDVAVGADLVEALLAFRKDCGCECRIVLELAKGLDFLLVRAESYTDYGARVGISHNERVYNPYGHPLLGQVLMATFACYGKAQHLATLPPEKAKIPTGA
jgi:hypothetical protein